MPAYSKKMDGKEEVEMNEGLGDEEMSVHSNEEEDHSMNGEDEQKGQNVPAVIQLHNPDNFAPAVIQLHNPDNFAPAVIQLHNPDNFVPAVIRLSVNNQAPPNPPAGQVPPFDAPNNPAGIQLPVNNQAPPNLPAGQFPNGTNPNQHGALVNVLPFPVTGEILNAMVQRFHGLIAAVGFQQVQFNSAEAMFNYLEQLHQAVSDRHRFTSGTRRLLGSPDAETIGETEVKIDAVIATVRAIAGDVRTTRLYVQAPQPVANQPPGANQNVMQAARDFPVNIEIKHHADAQTFRNQPVIDSQFLETVVREVSDETAGLRSTRARLMVQCNTFDDFLNRVNESVRLEEDLCGVILPGRERATCTIGDISFRIGELVNAQRILAQMQTGHFQGVDPSQVPHALVARIARMTGQFNALRECYLRTANLVMPLFSVDPLDPRAFIAENVDSGNNAINQYIQQIQAAVNRVTTRLADLSQLLVNVGNRLELKDVDHNFANFDDVFQRKVNQYDAGMRVNQMAREIANRLQRPGEHPANLDTALADMLRNQEDVQTLNRRLENFSRLSAILVRRDITVEGLMTFLKGQLGGENPGAAMSRLNKLESERDELMAYSQFCVAIQRQMMFSTGQLLNTVKDVFTRAMEKLRVFFAANNGDYVSSVVQSASAQLSVILESDYEFNHSSFSGILVERKSREQGEANSVALFNTLESLIRFSTAVLFKRKDNAARVLRNSQGTIDEAWDLLYKIHSEWIDKTVKIAEAFVYDPERSRPGEIVTKGLELLTMFTRTGVETALANMERFATGFTDLTTLVANEATRIRSDISERVTRCVKNHQNLLKFREGQANFGNERGGGMIPEWMYVDEMRNFLVDLLYSFNTESGDSKRRGDVDRIITQELPKLQETLTVVKTERTALKKERDSFESRLKTMARVYASFSGNTRKAMLQLIEKSARLSLQDSDVVNAGAELAAGELPNRVY